MDSSLSEYLRLYLASYIPHTSSPPHPSKHHGDLDIYSAVAPVLAGGTLARTYAPHSHFYLQMVKLVIKQKLSTNDSYKTCTALLNDVLEEDEFWGGEINPYTIQLNTVLT